MARGSTSFRSIRQQILTILAVASILIFIFFSSKKPSPESISEELFEFIKSKEGFSSSPYPDGPGYSIGYGHFLHTPSDLLSQRNLTQKEAELVLKEDIEKVIKNIIHEYPEFVKLNQGKRDALTSLIFNWGLVPFLKSKLLKNLKTRKYRAAAHEFLDIVKSGGKVLKGLVIRRKEESEIFLNGW